MEDFIANYWQVIFAGITLFLTLIINIINQFRIIKNSEPQLTFSLRNMNGALYLMVENTGLTKATNINIDIKKLYNNGNDPLIEPFIFTIPFELAANEKVQAIISECKINYNSRVFPFINIKVSYFQNSFFNKKVQYERQVFFSESLEHQVYVNTNFDNEFKDLKVSINKIHSDLIRMANYFDGFQVNDYENTSITSGQTFQNHLVNALKREKNTPIYTNSAQKFVGKEKKQ